MMDPSVLIALASVVGAGVFTGAGYLMGDRRSRAQEPDEAMAPVEDAQDMRSHAAPSSSASYRTEEIEPLTQGTMQELLLDLAEQTVSFRVALYDQSGLLVESVGGPPSPAIGALVGLLANCLHKLEETAVVRQSPTLEVHDADHGTIRLRTIQWDGRSFLLTTIGPHRHHFSPTEDAVGDAIVTLLAS